MTSRRAPGPRPLAEETLPTRGQAAIFFLKTWGLRLARVGRESVRGCARRFAADHGSLPAGAVTESRGPLYPSGDGAEFALQVGKVQNLRVAAATLHGVVVPAGEVFSFWAHVPRPTKRRGFAAGRELREGCVIPSIGGGLCQLSNALYDAALTAGFEIVERHAHSRRLPGSMAAAGRDATVFWNYVDLRFRPPQGCRIETFLTRDELVVRLHAPGATPATFGPASASPSGNRVAEGPPVESCETCGVVACFRHPARSRSTSGTLTAWLVDGWWPEFDAYLQGNVRADDVLLVPLDGTRFDLRSYRWNTAGFRRVAQAPRETLRRAWSSRRLASQGAVRQRALLRFDAALAARYARMIPPAATHLVVSQNLLPFLWRSGVLGGRSFEVLMTRFPLEALQQTLDLAAARHPESATLADFRADPAIAEAEKAALAEAVHWITPHCGIARLAGARARLLPWHLPPATTAGPATFHDSGQTIFFPASTLGRKGAYELRAAAQELGLRVDLGGPVLESADFWRGVETRLTGPDGSGDARAVVLPAWVEYQPRRLLRAVAAGIPVIASEACGLAGVPGVTKVPTGDVAALVEALRQCVAESVAGR